MQRNFRADLRKVVAVALENGSWFIYLLNTPKAELGFNLFFISLHFYLFLFVYWKSSKSQVSKRVCPASYLENVGNGAGFHSHTRSRAGFNFSEPAPAPSKKLVKIQMSETYTIVPWQSNIVLRKANLVRDSTLSYLHYNCYHAITESSHTHITIVSV